jgi:hypothetical protein
MNVTEHLPLPDPEKYWRVQFEIRCYNPTQWHAIAIGAGPDIELAASTDRDNVLAVANEMDKRLAVARKLSDIK